MNQICSDFYQGTYSYSEDWISSGAFTGFTSWIYCWLQFRFEPAGYLSSGYYISMNYYGILWTIKDELSQWGLTPRFGSQCVRSALVDISLFFWWCKKASVIRIVPLQWCSNERIMDFLQKRDTSKLVWRWTMGFVKSYLEEVFGVPKILLWA